MIHLALLIIASFRGIVTFSRGGVFTALAMIAALIGVLYWYANAKTKNLILILSVCAVLIGGFVFPIFTGILIANQAKNFYEVFAMAYPMGIIFYFVIARLLTLWLMNKKSA